MSEKKVASIEEVLKGKGFKYDTIEAYDTVVRLGTLSSADILEWLAENEDPVKSKTAGLRILVKALCDAEGNRVPEEKREEYIVIFRHKDNDDNNRVIHKVLEMNGVGKGKELKEAVKND